MLTALALSLVASPDVIFSSQVKARINVDCELVGHKKETVWALIISA